MTAAADPAANPASTVKLNAPVIRFAMRVLGWSQAELARRTRVHESTISRALAGGPVMAELAVNLRLAFGDRLQLEEVLDISGLGADLPPGAVDEPAA